MATAMITSKGQTTIPKMVRDRLHLRPGDELEFLVEDDGTLRVFPKTGDVRALKGMVPKPRRPVSLKKMEEAISKGARGLLDV